MELGMIGLGKMGKHMALRLLEHDVRVVVWNRSSGPAQEVGQQGGVVASSLQDVVSKLAAPRIIWLMLPHNVVEEFIDDLIPLLDKQDIIVDGGNSYFKESVRRYEKLQQHNIQFVDVGVSGGLAAAKTGYCTMAGGDSAAYARVMPVLKALSVDNGYGHMGKPGSGHYAKMVHNAIEYGMMQALGEGFELLHKADFDFDLSTVARVWQHGSIIRSLLVDLSAQALEKDKTLSSYAAVVDDSGEGRWSVKEAIDLGVPFTVNTYAVYARFVSRDTDSLAMKMLSALREGFGGHPVKKK